MLRRISVEMRYAQERAAEMAERAKTASSEADRKFYLDCERNWRLLVRSYELVERLERFSNAYDKRKSDNLPPINQVQIHHLPGKT